MARKLEGALSKMVCRIELNLCIDKTMIEVSRISDNNILVDIRQGSCVAVISAPSMDDFKTFLEDIIKTIREAEI